MQTANESGWLVPQFYCYLPLSFLLVQSKIQAEGLDSEAALDEAIKKLENDLRRARKKEAGEMDDGPQEEPSFPLLDVPDADVGHFQSFRGI